MIENIFIYRKVAERKHVEALWTVSLNSVIFTNKTEVLSHNSTWAFSHKLTHNLLNFSTFKKSRISLA